MFAVDEIVDHTALDRPGTVQRIECREILDASRLVTAENVAHAVRFELEDGSRFAAGEEFIGFGVVQGEIIDVHLRAAVLFNHAHGIVQHSERCEAKKIHFQQADALQRIHVVLRGDFIAIGLVHGDDIG